MLLCIGGAATNRSFTNLVLHVGLSERVHTCAVSVWNWMPFGAVYPSGM